MKRNIEITTADGIAKASIFRPDGSEGKVLPGIVYYMDALGPRQATDIMAERLANAGYIVLAPDLFYRFGAYGPFDGASFGNETSRAEIMKMLHATTQEMTKRDSKAFLDALEVEGAAGPFGAVGYCMGGGRALTAAATYPDRIAAVASFHGGNLASEAPDSPHRLAGDIKARVYVGVAGVDGTFPPEQSARLAEALRIGGVDHIIENYIGMSHGWTVPDRGELFSEKGAERHWKRLLELFSETLG